MRVLRKYQHKWTVGRETLAGTPFGHDMLGGIVGDWLMVQQITVPLPRFLHLCKRSNMRIQHDLQRYLKRRAIIGVTLTNYTIAYRWRKIWSRTLKECKSLQPQHFKNKLKFYLFHRRDLGSSSHLPRILLKPQWQFRYFVPDFLNRYTTRTRTTKTTFTIT